MRLSGNCVNCILLLAGYFGGTWASLREKGCRRGSSEKSGHKDFDRPWPWDQLLAQKKLERELGPGCPQDHQIRHGFIAGDRYPTSRIYDSNTYLASVKTEVTISQPKITQAPILKRKVGSNKWDIVHEGIQGQKRDAAQCGAGYQSCAASLSGGCCPTDRICGTDSCYAESTLPATVCGVAGYVPCGMAEGGGCCPQSYACQVAGCSPSPGVSKTETCGFSSYLCPESLGYGCCLSGFACGVTACYATSVTTFVVTETLTTTDAANLPHTVTSTIITASTPTVPTDVASNTAPDGVIAKVTPTPTAIPKTSPIGISSSSGITKTQLDGIIGGTVALLVILIIASFLIIRRLNKVVKATTAAQSQTRRSSSGQRSRPQHHPRPSASDIDATSVDPLMMNPSETSRSVGFSPHRSIAHSSAHEVDGSSSSPPYFSGQFSPRSPPFNHYPHGYNAVPTFDSSSYSRNPSVESTPLGQNSTAGYFDIALQPDLRDQNLRFGHSQTVQRPFHERNLSDVSNQSEKSAGSSSLVELDAGADGRSSLQKALQSFGIGRISSRRRGSQTNPSPTTVMSGQTIRHPQSGPGPNPGAFGLGYIPEAGESRLVVHEAGGTEMRQISLLDQHKYPGRVNTGEQR